ncbi:MAG: RNA 2',3'-cyclic phosphodiesterase [Terracidiphilus sp.]
MRLFVGIPLADAATRELAAVVEQLQDAGREKGRTAVGLRWSTPDSWHITLQFLGNATEEQLECLKARLGEVRAAAVPVKLGELGCFDRAGVFFADVTVTPELAALERSVVAATGRCGFAEEARPLHPHITLARAKGDARRAGLRELLSLVPKNLVFQAFAAHEILLYESHLGAGGARYEARMRVALAGSWGPMAGGND